MASKTKIPYVVRWRNALMDDPNPVLTWRALAAAMPLVRHADLDGRNCYPGAKKCADEMRVGRRTILRGWDELEQAGWLEVLPLPSTRRRTQGALKVLRWPADMVHDRHHVESSNTSPATPTWCPPGRDMVPVVHPTITGNRGRSASAAPCEWKACKSDGTVENFGGTYCEKHAAAMYAQATSSSS